MCQTIKTFTNPSITTITPYTADYRKFKGHTIINDNRNVQFKYTDYNTAKAPKFLLYKYTVYLIHFKFPVPAMHL
jgi:hypothetical protein